MRIKSLFALFLVMLLLTGCQGQSVSGLSQVEAATVDVAEDEWANTNKTSGEFCDSLMLNVVTDNELFGDEHQFARFVEVGIDGFILEDYQAEVPRVLEPGDSCLVLVCCHNATNPDLGDEAYARDVCLSVSAPSVKAGEDSSINVKLRYEGNWPDSEREQIGCKLPITTNDGIKLSVSEYATLYQGESSRKVEDVASAYGQGLSSTNSRIYELCRGIAPGDENLIYVVVQINAR